MLTVNAAGTEIRVNARNGVRIGEEQTKKYAQEAMDYLLSHYMTDGTNEIYFTTTGDLLIFGTLDIEGDNAIMELYICKVERTALVSISPGTAQIRQLV